MHLHAGVGEQTRAHGACASPAGGSQGVEAVVQTLHVLLVMAEELKLK